jgi:4-hydroxy-3-polyprenylbenzoate decarboxylase
LQAIKSIDSRIQNVRLLNDTMLVLQVNAAGREILEKLSSARLSTTPIIAAISSDVSLIDDVLLLWGLFTRFDCERDTFFGNVEIKGGHPVYSGPLFIDATWKAGYPDPLKMNEDVIQLVDKRWYDYGFKKELC